MAINLSTSSLLLRLPDSAVPFFGLLDSRILLGRISSSGKTGSPGLMFSGALNFEICFNQPAAHHEPKHLENVECRADDDLRTTKPYIVLRFFMENRPEILWVFAGQKASL